MTDKTTYCRDAIELDWGSKATSSTITLSTLPVNHRIFVGAIPAGVLVTGADVGAIPAGVLVTGVD